MYILKEHLLVTDTTKSIPVFFVLSFTSWHNVASSWAIREASFDTMKQFVRYSRSILTEASENNNSMCLCLINNSSQYLSNNFYPTSLSIASSDFKRQGQVMLLRKHNIFTLSKELNGRWISWYFNLCAQLLRKW